MPSFIVIPCSVISAASTAQESGNCKQKKYAAVSAASNGRPIWRCKCRRRNGSAVPPPASVWTLFSTYLLSTWNFARAVRSAESVSGPTGACSLSCPISPFLSSRPGPFVPKHRFGTENTAHRPLEIFVPTLIVLQKSEKHEPCVFVKFARCWATFPSGKQQAQHEGKKRTPANAGVLLSAVSLWSGEKG